MEHMFAWPKYLLFVLTASLSIGATYSVSERIDEYQWYYILLAPISIIGFGILWRWAGPAFVEGQNNDYYFFYAAVVFGYWFIAWAWFVDPFNRQEYWKIVNLMSWLCTIVSCILQVIWILILKPRFLNTRHPNVFGLVTAVSAYFLTAFTWLSIPIYLDTWLLIASWAFSIVGAIFVIFVVIDFLIGLLK